MKAWCLRDPFGGLVPGTLAEGKLDAQVLAFQHLYDKFPNGWPKGYWKRLTPFIRARKGRGWHVVEVKLVACSDAKA